MSITLLIADHHVAAAAGVRSFLAGSEIEVVSEASDGNRAVELAGVVGPDVILMAVGLPKEDGLSALARIKQSRPETAVVMTGCDNHQAHVAQAHKLGASGFLLKDFTRDRLLSTIRRAAAGEHVWSRDEVRRVTGVLTSPRLKPGAEAPLTPRESDVLEHVARGLTNRQIADQLGISFETVKEHVQHVIHKIGVADRTQAAVWAVRSGLV